MVNQPGFYGHLELCPGCGRPTYIDHNGITEDVTYNGITYTPDSARHACPNRYRRPAPAAIRRPFGRPRWLPIGQ